MPSDNVISSLQNPKVKNVVKLRNRKTREKTNLTIVEGFREVLRAHEAGIKFKELYYCLSFIDDNEREKIIRKISSKSDASFETDEKVFKKIAFGDRLEGVLALCLKPKHTLDELKLSRDSIVVIAEGLEKPGNLGAILRTCDGAGVDALIVSDGITDIYNPNVIRASTGAVFSSTVIESTNKKTLEFLKEKKFRICATSPDAPIPYINANLKAPIAVVLGNEKEGLSDFWLKNSDERVMIPMRGKTDSLNVSVTAALVVFEAIRQRNLRS